MTCAVVSRLSRRLCLPPIPKPLNSLGVLSRAPGHPTFPYTIPQGGYNLAINPDVSITESEGTLIKTTSHLLFKYWPFVLSDCWALTRCSICWTLHPKGPRQERVFRMEAFCISCLLAMTWWRPWVFRNTKEELREIGYKGNGLYPEQLQGGSGLCIPELWGCACVWLLSVVPYTHWSWRVSFPFPSRL